MTCLPDSFSLYFEAVDCVQLPASTITLHRVYRSWTYWNSALVLPHYGCTIQTWADMQLHLYCVHRPNDAINWRLWWTRAYRPNSRGCTSESHAMRAEWELVSESCDPFQLVFATDSALPGEGCRAADDCFSLTAPSFTSTILRP